MRRLALMFLTPLVSMIVGASTVAAADSASRDSSETAKIAALVRRLGDNSFEVRQTAHAQLEKLGKVAKSALEEGAKDPDLEIRSRSKRLLDLVNRTDVEIAIDTYLADKDTNLILKLPAWERYKKYAGDDQASRSVFVGMYTNEGNLLGLLERDPKTFQTAFVARLQDIQRSMYTPWGGRGTPLEVGQVIALLFAATDSRISTDVTSFYLLTNLCCQQNIRQSFESNVCARKLLVQFFEQRNDQNTQAQAIQVAMQLNIKEMAPAALKLATNKNAQPWTKATALLAVGKLGTKEHIKDIEPLLNDTTALGTIRLPQTNNLSTEMRDVALAAMILLSGQDIQDYDFPYLKAVRIDKQYLAYNYFGFKDNTEREAVLKKFKESREMKEKK
jgi:hypothetical protein